MSFPSTSPKVPGYSKEQVDAIYGRAQRQLSNPGLRMLTAEILGAVKFDLVRGGYQITAVDEELARLADVFDQRDIRQKIAREGQSAVSQELNEILKTLRPILEKGPKEAFSKTKGGYRPSLVNKLVKKIEIRRSSLSAPDSFTLRTVPLGRSRRGYSRSEVDDFLALVIAASHRQEALG